MKHLILFSLLSFFTISASAQTSGCSLIWSCNYDTNAVEGDYTLCDFSCWCGGTVGCVDETAINYDPEVTYNNPYTCIYPPQDDIDFNDDGIIGAADLVVFLSYYGGEWP